MSLTRTLKEDFLSPSLCLQSTRKTLLHSANTTSASVPSHTQHPKLGVECKHPLPESEVENFFIYGVHLKHLFISSLLDPLAWIPCLPQNTQFTKYLLVSYHVSDNGDQQMNNTVSELPIGEADVYSVPCDKR